MIRSLAALAILAFMGVSALALPGFAPEMPANGGAALAKADRFAIPSVAGNCATQTWPNIASICLRNPGTDVAVREARLVTAKREP